eukprot:TRINITY_DN2671_c0_g1_i1.p1 TRINITY_DN2671_c0_g1~~TRINITY_DN2671_c0_g1_i1.p1  ORF type:complete len:610 (-),score=108.88 TRINITY_DN2671_c0_g1_i1:38-1663(-)
MDYGLPNEDLSRAGSEIIEGVAPIEHFSVRSSRVPLQTNYAIAVFKGNGLHLTPVQKMYQMRPDFKAIDDRDRQKEQRKEEAKRQKSDNKEVPENNLKQQHAHISQESDRSKWIREHSWSYLKGLEDEEPFQHLGVQHREDMMGEHFDKLLYQDELTPYEIPWNLDRKTYLAAINPQPLNDDFEFPENKAVEKEYSLYQIRRMNDLATRIQHVLKKIQITKFYSIFEYLQLDEKDDRNVLKELMSLAVLVSGVFVLKSSKVPGEPYEQAVRNYALYEFAMHDFVSASELERERDIPPKILSRVLTPIATCENGIWKLKVSPDERFLANPNLQKVILGAKKTWVNGKDKIVSDLSTSKERKQRGTRLDVGAEAALQRYQVEIPETTEGKEVVHFLFGLFQGYGVVSSNTIAYKLKAELNSATSSFTQKNISNQLIRTCLPLLAVNLGNNIWCLKSCGDPDLDPYRKIVVDLFSQSISLTKQQIDQACINQLGKNMPTNFYDKILKELAYRPPQAQNPSQPLQAKWILKSGTLTTDGAAKAKK